MALACCFLGKVLGVGCHYFHPPLDIPTFAARYLHVCTTREILVAKGGTVGEILSSKFSRNDDFTPFWDFFCMQQSTTWDRRLYFSSEGRRAEDFFALKIRQLRPGLNPQPRVPLDHRSRCEFIYDKKK